MTVFLAKIAAFEQKALRRLEDVVKQSAQEVFSRAQTPQQGIGRGAVGYEIGKVPVDTGFLRNTFAAGLNGSTAMQGPDAYVMAIAGMELGDSVIGGWTAKYARAVEYGTATMGGRRFAGTAAAAWQQIVAANVARVQASG